jgi:hypothetical protein
MTGATVCFVNIDQSTGIAVVATVTKASSEDAAADLVRGVSLGAFLWDSRSRYDRLIFF